MTCEIATNEVIMIPLNKLIASDLNARKTASPEGGAELKASLLAFGVLENLIVYDAGKQKFAVAAGERRRTVLKALAKDKTIRGDFPVPCIVRSEDEAVELSLAENIVRVAMHPLDQFAAFAALIDEGKSVEDVAARFGITPGIVTRRMKLARVAPVVLEAFREQAITLEAVMGFAVSDDHAEQGRVYAEIVSRGGAFTRQYIVRMLTHQKVATDDERFLYIGEEAYILAGGTISRDLFDEEGGGYADDSALLDRLVLENLTVGAPAYLSEGWKWVEPVLAVSFETKRGYARISPRHYPLSAENSARQAALATQLDEIAEQTNNQEPEDGPLAESYLRIQAELQDFEAREYVFAPTEMVLAGGWLTLDRDGHPSAELGYVRRDDLEALDSLRRAALPSQPEADEDESNDTGEGVASIDENADDDDATGHDDLGESPSTQGGGLSDALLTDLHAARTVALRLELMDTPEIALRTIAHSLAGSLILNETSVLTVIAREIHISAISQVFCPRDDGLGNRVGRWRTRLSEGKRGLWHAVMALDASELLDLIAVCAALSVDATHSKTSAYDNRRRMGHADQLAETLGLDMSRYWTPTAGSYFGRVSKKAICIAVAEAAGEGIAFRIQDLKKPIMAAEAETIAAKTGWLPAVLRTKGVPVDHTATEALAAE